MSKRERRLKKQIKGLLKQSDSHDYKIKNEGGRLETTVPYWEKEKAGYDKQIREKLEKLERMKKKRLGDRANVE